jgi:DNA-binding transcriptional MocR family regulator
MGLRSALAALADWENGPGPLYERLATGLRGAIERGDIPLGTRLPPERTLAAELDVSRTTVVGAYGALRELGWVESRQGSGTYVCRASSQGAPSAHEKEIVGVFRRNIVFRGLLEDSGSTVEFLGAHLDAAPEVEETVRDLVRRLDPGALCGGHGYQPLGLPALRKAVAEHLTRRGVPTRLEEVLVTNGAQQAIHLTVALLIERGDSAVIEDPTYLGAIDTLVAAGARMVAIPTGADGADLTRLKSALLGGPRLAYLIPTYHNPTGVVMPEAARRAVARLAEETQVPIVEDQALADVVLGDEPPPAIAAFARGATLLTVGSMSKLFWGGLRVGWVRGPEAFVERLARLKALSDLGSPVLSQVVATHLLPSFERVQRARREAVTRKREALTALLRQRLPSWAWRQPSGGLLLWVRLPRGNANEFAQVALRHGVALVPGTVNSPSGGYAQYVRLPFIDGTERLTEGVARLARAWSEYETGARERRADLGVIV